jgi:hypothetical protein
MKKAEALIMEYRRALKSAPSNEHTDMFYELVTLINKGILAERFIADHLRMGNKGNDSTFIKDPVFGGIMMGAFELSRRLDSQRPYAAKVLEKLQDAKIISKDWNNN